MSAARAGAYTPAAANASTTTRPRPTRLIRQPRKARTEVFVAIQCFRARLNSAKKQQPTVINRGFWRACQAPPAASVDAENPLAELIVEAGPDQADVELDGIVGLNTCHVQSATCRGGARSV